MASILSGYEYDIFVSYRHNDNKYDGWVTEFVEKLSQELDATLKDNSSMYLSFFYPPLFIVIEYYLK